MASSGSAQLGGYGSRVAYLQRTDLDDQGLRVADAEVQAALRTALPLQAQLPLWFAEIAGLPRAVEPRDSRDPAYETLDILAGLSGQDIGLYFGVRGEPRSTHLFFASMDRGEGHGGALRAMLEGHYPGIQLRDEAQNAQRLAELRAFLASCSHMGVLTGLPTPDPGLSATFPTQMDRLIRGLYGTSWALLVLADPLAESALSALHISTLREMQRLAEEAAAREAQESVARTIADYYRTLLQRREEFFNTCLRTGGWWAQAYVAAPDAASYGRAKALLRAVLSGEEGRTERVRILDCPGAGPKAASFSPILVERAPAPTPELAAGGVRMFKYHTLLSSKHLSALVHVPREEMPGYFVTDVAAFDVTSHVPPDVKAVGLGEILERRRPTGNAYRVPVEQLDSHCLVVGITGSGKTNTVFHLLQQLQSQGQALPFLVLEPAKREYRNLAKLLPPGSELRVFTVGEEGVGKAPFRFNPFEVRPGVPVQTHIDLLKSVFNASFGMWTPLPQVLERAIHEIYQDKGWDPVHSTNRRDPEGAARVTGWHRDAQPTLTDLFLKVSELVPRLGYDKEVTRNIRTALETRINSLRTGAKGLTLDTPLSIPVEKLLQRPTVLELEGIGDDDEKAFLMGLILCALYEYYRTQPSPVGSGLRHLTVVEEAHRLLASAPVSMDPEASNLRGKAVETFVSMLSEVRAYGEGFVIAEQIPTKLAPDVIKNTALKVMHRIVASDDRVVMGGAMNLNEEQVRQVVSLSTGQAVVHGGGHFGDDAALQIQVPLAKGTERARLGAEQAQQIWSKFVAANDLSRIYLSYATCQSHCVPPNPSCAAVRRVAEMDTVRDAFASFALATVVGSLSRQGDDLAAWASSMWSVVDTALRPQLDVARADADVARCAVTHAAHQYMATRGVQYGWTYPDVARVTELLLSGVLGICDAKPSEAGARDLGAFCEQYVASCRLGQEPFYGCARSCGNPPTCLFRYAMSALLRVDELTREFTKAGADWAKLAEACEKAAERAVFPLSPRQAPRTDTDVGALRAAAYCFAVQRMHADPAAWTLRRRTFALNALLEHYGW